ncbi:hypothetical protein [Falsiroseomonas sp. CW058]|uniref:hypothetical protein n=1 Tax=Falsiroseomonas sp. CW058 TaxID=3388664 RepID=UPI003D32360A
MSGAWLLLMVWTGAHGSTGGVAAPAVVPFASEAVCRLVGAQYEDRWRRSQREWRNTHLIEWRCVYNGN